jgi:hypothetical protein
MSPTALRTVSYLLVPSIIRSIALHTWATSKREYIGNGSSVESWDVQTHHGKTRYHATTTLALYLLSQKFFSYSFLSWSTKRIADRTCCNSVADDYHTAF